MSNVTKIEWTAWQDPSGAWRPGYTSNPIYALNRETGKRGHMCVHASPGCERCYSEQWNGWRGNGLQFRAQDLTRAEFVLNEKEIGAWRKLPAGARCFVADMTDLFGEWVSDEWLDRVFAGMALAPQVAFQILTKRADRMRDYMAPPRGHRVWEAAGRIAREAGREDLLPTPPEWPLPGVWLGVSVEDQRRADERIPALLNTPAAVRFLSCEPLLGPIDLFGDAFDDASDRENLGPAVTMRGYSYQTDYGTGIEWDADYEVGIDWCIIGGESGRGARSMGLPWARSLVKQCRAASVPCFVKQLGARPVEYRPMLNFDDAEDMLPHIVPLKHPKGGMVEEWPADLRVREFPTEARPDA